MDPASLAPSCPTPFRRLERRELQNGSGAAGSESVKTLFAGLWRGVASLETKAALVAKAIREAVDVTGSHLSVHEQRELPRSRAMLDAASIIAEHALMRAGITATAGNGS